MITLGLAEAHWRRETLAESGRTHLSALLHHAPAFLAPGIYTDATSHEAAIWGHSGIPIREAASSALCVDHSAMRCVRRCPEAPLRGELCGYRVGRGRGEGKSTCWLDGVPWRLARLGGTHSLDRAKPFATPGDAVAFVQQASVSSAAPCHWRGAVHRSLWRLPLCACAHEPVGTEKRLGGRKRGQSNWDWRTLSGAPCRSSCRARGPATLRCCSRTAGTPTIATKPFVASGSAQAVLPPPGSLPATRGELLQHRWATPRGAGIPERPASRPASPWAAPTRLAALKCKARAAARPLRVPRRSSQRCVSAPRPAGLALPNWLQS